ncbi:MAG: hypothetical protein EPN82_10205 [Bacteroidetes bacterium]|nr:MAG: hypothetical protein EPN82_10205 [Bacteroidota bacterium]
MKTIEANSVDVINIIKNNISHIKEYDVKKLALFGSYSRYDALPESDCDILVKFGKNTFRTYIGLKEYLENLLKLKVDLVCEDSIKDIIKPYILKDAIWLVS